MIQAYLVDDEDIAKRRLKTLLKEHPDVEVTGSASSYSEAIKGITQKKPDLIFLDIELGSRSGFEVLDEIRKRGIFSKVIFVTAYEQYAIKALRKKAVDYLLKPVDIDELNQALHGVIHCNDTEQLQCKLDQLEFLTPQEKRIITHLVAGKTSKQIAEELGISARTVETHRRNILKKVGVSSTVEIIKMLLSNPPV